MDTAILVLIAAVIGGGVTGAVATTWGLHLNLLRLKNRVDASEISLETLKNQLVAEIKRRAGEKGRDQRMIDKELETLARSLPAKNIPPTFERQWWEVEQSNHAGS
jgi:hypothetical protein